MNIANFIYKRKIYFVFLGGVLSIVTFIFLIKTFLFHVTQSADLIINIVPARNDTLYITLAEDIEISNEWKEIDLTNIDFSRKDINSIHIVVDSSYNVFVGENRGIAPPQGETFLPQIAVEDIEGNRCDLRFSGRLGDDTASFWDISETRCFAEPKKCKTLLVKSASKFIAKKILWSGFDVRDMK